MSEPVSEDGGMGEEPALLTEAQESPAPEPQLDEAAAALLAPEPARAAPATLGSVLRAARLARGLTIVDVTQAIKFGARQIEALERDELDKLPGTTFVRGLVRSYGKFLRIEETPLLVLLGEQQAPVVSEVHAPEDTGAKVPLSGERRSALPWLALAVALLAVVVALATYLEWPGAAKPKASAPAKLQAPSVQVQQAAGTEPGAAAASAAAPIADGRQLIFDFKDKAWVEVKDATQKIIFAQNNEAGTHQLVIGKPPFELVIGNASSVELHYEEKMVDLRPHTKVEVARLTLE